MDEITVRPMNGGNGLYSYTNNSTMQRKVIIDAKELINKAIEELDIKTFMSSKIIKIADLGCSAGPNTFLAMQNIIDSFERKFRNEQKQSNIDESEFIIPEFQVLFSDLATNDFNHLFISLPRDRKYFAAGVPGSFYGKLFPKDSLHAVHSSCAMHWLSRIPEEVTEKSSPAWNKGRVYYSNSTDKVARAYEAQFSKDMDKFLKFRAQEIVRGGLLAFIICGRSNGTSHSKTYSNKAMEQLESTLIDMAKEGKVKDEKIDSFNIPLYYASPEEVVSAVKRSGCFKMETMQIVPHETQQPKVMSSILRAALEWTVKEHFGEEILDELFSTVLPKKLEDLFVVSESFESIFLFFSLKCVKNE